MLGINALIYTPEEYIRLFSMRDEFKRLSKLSFSIEDHYDNWESHEEFMDYLMDLQPRVICKYRNEIDKIFVNISRYHVIDLEVQKVGTTRWRINTSFKFNWFTAFYIKFAMYKAFLDGQYNEVLECVSFTICNEIGKSTVRLDDIKITDLKDKLDDIAELYCSYESTIEDFNVLVRTIE